MRPTGKDTRTSVLTPDTTFGVPGDSPGGYGVVAAPLPAALELPRRSRCLPGRIAAPLQGPAGPEATEATRAAARALARRAERAEAGGPVLGWEVGRSVWSTKGTGCSLGRLTGEIEG